MLPPASPVLIRDKPSTVIFSGADVPSLSEKDGLRPENSGEEEVVPGSAFWLMLETMAVLPTLEQS